MMDEDDEEEEEVEESEVDVAQKPVPDGVWWVIWWLHWELLND